MEIQRIGIIGVGLMGAGIAEMCARTGYDTLVREINDEFLDKANEELIRPVKGGHKALKSGSWTVTWAEGTKKIPMISMFLKPVPITADNLDYVISAGWATKDQVCKGVQPTDPGAAACK